MRSVITVDGVNHCLLIILISVYDPRPGDLTLFCISFGMFLLFRLDVCFVLQAHAQITAEAIHINL